MILDTEERVAYWGYKHMNVTCRDINDEEEADLVGLERILYGVGFLGITNLVGLKAWEESDELFFENDDSDGIDEPEYEPVASELNPFEYEDGDESPEDQIYQAVLEQDAAEFEQMLIAEESSEDENPPEDDAPSDKDDEDAPAPVLDILDYLPPNTRAA